MIKILILDDHEIIRIALKMTMNDLLPQAMVTDTGTVELALKEMTRVRYDLLVLDMGLGEYSFGTVLDNCTKVSPQTRILVFTQSNPVFYARRVLALGAYGFLSKAAPEHQIKEALNTILNGRKYVPPELNDPDIDNPYEVLTNREFEIMQLVARGKSPLEVAHSLGISASTVATHEKNILQKLSLQSKADITRMALKYRLWM